MSTFIQLFLCITLLTSGQILWKLGLSKCGGFQLSSISAATLAALFTSPPIVIGLILYVVATLIWFGVLSRLPLSVAYPLMSMSYVLGLVASSLILHEHVSAIRWAGGAVICFGVFLIAQN